MQNPSNAFPPPSPPPNPTPPEHSPKPSSGGLDVLDVVLFFVGFFVVVGVCVAVPAVPAKAGLILGIALIAARHLVWPPKPRVLRPGTTLVGVFVGLSAVAAVLVLGFAGLGVVRLAEREPDWSARRAETIADLRSHPVSSVMPDIFGSSAQYDAQYQRIADEEVARARQDYLERRRDSLDTTLKLSGAGVLLLALAMVAERARTRPV